MANTYSIAELAGRLGAVLEGDGVAMVSGLASISEAQPGDLTFLANPRYESEVAGTRASAILVKRDWQGTCPCSVLRVADPDRAFAEAAALLRPVELAVERGVHPTAVVDATAVLGVDVAIGPHCVVERGAKVGDRTVLCAGAFVGRDAVVGADCLIYQHVSIRERVRVGDRVILHCGAVLGSDGFGYYFERGQWKKIQQIGIVEVGDDAEIGANATIDRARFGTTRIGKGVKIDNLVQVAHNVSIGDNTAIAAQVGISGSSEVGRGVRMGGQAGVSGHVAIGDGAIVAARAGVTKDVEAGLFVSGFPAMSHRKAMKLQASQALIPALRSRLAALERKLGAGGAGEEGESRP